jgi:hypothetical protein
MSIKITCVRIHELEIKNGTFSVLILRKNLCSWKGRIIECVTIPTHELRAFCVQNEIMRNCCIGLCYGMRHVF